MIVAKKGLAPLPSASGSPRAHPFAAAVNPDLARILGSLRLDKRFVRARGSWMEDEAGQRYLDFTSGYGGLPFGHSPKEVFEALKEVLEAEEPVLAQPSLLEGAGDLAEALVAIAPPGLDQVCFANSGAEAVEVVLKIARSATGRVGVLSTERAFHGKTLGALSATGRADYQADFGAPVAGFDRIPYGDLSALERRLAAEPRKYSCFLVEPIQGEGGIRVPPSDYLSGAERICDAHGVLFALDEVQTGLGRTGSMFACEGQASPHLMALGKALGGGVLPSAAVLFRSGLLTEAFALRHSSTFAGNGLAARLGTKVLELLGSNDQALVRRVETIGERLKSSLRGLHGRYPDLIREVRGRGFLLGLELTTQIDAFDRQCLLGSMAAQETLALALSSYLLNVEQVRLAPTVLASSVLRIEPPLTVEEEECDLFVHALDRTLEVFADGDSARALAHLCVDGPRPPQRKRETAKSRRQDLTEAGEGASHFAFLLHPLDNGGLRDFDETLAPLSEAELACLFERLREGRSSLAPVAMSLGVGRVDSRSGATATGEIFGLPYTATMLLQLSSAEATRLVREAVELARDRGAEVVGLGAYTSIVTANAMALDDLGVPVTTGNGFTAASAVEAVGQAVEAKGLDLEEAKVAVVGASGAIGGSVTRLLARKARALVLLGNPAKPQISMKRLRVTALGLMKALRACGEEVQLLSGLGDGDEDALGQLTRESRLHLSLDLDSALAEADVVVVATSTPEPIVASSLLKRGAVVCDIAQPPNTTPAVWSRRDITFFQGGIVELPGGRPFGVNYGLAPGRTYACMAETMVLALEGESALASVGSDLPDEAVIRLAQLARKHGFRLPEVTAPARAER